MTNFWEQDQVTPSSASAGSPPGAFWANDAPVGAAQQAMRGNLLSLFADALNGTPPSKDDLSRLSTLKNDLTNPDPATHYSNLIPFARGPAGDVRFAPPTALQDAMRAFTAPKRALTGEMDESQMPQEARNLAANIMLGANAGMVGRAPAEAGTLAMNVMTPIARGASKTVTAAAQPILDRINPETAIGRILAKRVMQQNPGMSLEDAMATTQSQLSKLGPQGVLADTGKSFQRLADNMAQNPGETAGIAEKILGDRSASQGSRLVGSVEDNVSPSGFYDVKAANDATKKTAGPNYERSYEKYPSVTSPSLQLLLKDEPLVMQGIKQGVELQRIEHNANALKTGDATPFNPKRFGVVDFNDAGDPVLGDVTPLRLWHAGRQGLDSILETYRNPMTGKLDLDPRGNRIQDLRGSLSDTIKSLTGGAEGDFAKGDAVYAGAAKLNDALAKGRSFARGDEEITGKYFTGLSPSEQDAYRSGVAREMTGMIRKSGAAPAALKTALKDTALRDKLKVILPSEGQFNKFIDDLQNEVTFQNTSNAVRGGSQTFQRGAEDVDAAHDVLKNMAGIASSGSAMGAIAKSAAWAANTLKRLQMPQATRDRIGKLLISQDQSDKDEAFRLLSQVQKSDWRYTP